MPYNKPSASLKDWVDAGNKTPKLLTKDAIQVFDDLDKENEATESHAANFDISSLSNNSSHAQPHNFSSNYNHTPLNTNNIPSETLVSPAAM